MHTVFYHLYEFQEQMQLIYMVKEIRVTVASGRKDWLERGMKEFSGMMEMFFILI